MAGRVFFIAPPEYITLSLQTLCMAITLPLTIGLVMLLIWNLHLALSNKTTIEHHEGVTAKVQVGH
jgi:uncharacterized membrane protein YiaA